MEEFRKVGRLYIGGDGLIHIDTDDEGEIGTMTIQDVSNVLVGIEPQPVNGDGFSDLSQTGLGLKFTIPETDGQLYVAIAIQVVRMIMYPWKKAALFIPITDN